MEKANIAIKYDVKFDVLCDADEFRKHMERLSDLGYDIVTWHNDGGNCIDLDRYELEACSHRSSVESDPDLLKFVNTLLELGAPEKDDIHIEIY